MNVHEEKMIADGFFKVMEAAYRHGALDKYNRISGLAQAAAADEVGLRIGDFLNTLNDLDAEAVKKGEAALAKLLPFLDILASDVLWATISRLLDNQFIQQLVWEKSKKTITGVEKNILKDNFGSLLSEVMQFISASPEEKARIGRLFEVLQQMIGPKSMTTSKETAQ